MTASKNRILYFINHEKFILLGGLAIGVVSAAAYFLYLYTPMYNTEARLFIRNVPKGNVIAEYGDNESVKSQSGYSNPLFNYREILASEALAARAYTILEKEYPEDLKKLGIRSQAGWAKKYEGMIKTKVIPSTDIIKVDFKWDNKQTTQQVFNLIISEFKKLNLEIGKQNEVSNTQYLDEQLALASTELDDVRTEIKNFRQSNHAIDITNESTELTRARVELEKQVQLLQSQAAFNRAKFGDISRQLGIGDAKTALRAVGVGSDPLLVQLNQNLALAQQNYAKLKAKFKDDYPATKEAKSQLESLISSINKRTQETLGSGSGSAATDGANASGRGIYDASSASMVTDMARVQADGVSVSAQMRALQRGIGTLQQQERVLPLKQLGLDTLLKKERALTLAYEQLSAKQMEAHLKENMIIDNIVLLNAPTLPTWALSDLVIKLFAFIMISVLLSAAIAWIKHDIQDQWLEQDEIEQVTGKKVLGSLPWQKRLAQTVSRDYFQAPKSMQGIAYANIANTLIARSYVANIKTISFMSIAGARHDSPIVHNLAATLARLGKSVVVIDADFENPGKLLSSLQQESQQSADLVSLILDIQADLRMAKQSNDAELARSIASALVRIPCVSGASNPANFHYLSAKESSASVHEILALPAFKMLLDMLASQYDFVLLDAPGKPIIYPEVMTVANACDASILLSSLTSTRQELITAISQLEKNENKLLGIIPREKNNELERVIDTDFKRSQVKTIEKISS